MEQQKIDLDALEAALAKSAPISGTTMTSHHIVSRGYEHMANLCRENMGPITMTYKEESDAIAASYNALPALIAELRELRARTTPEPIGDKHRDGNWWLVWVPGFEHWLKCRFQHDQWMLSGPATAGLCDAPTHALSMPPAPEASHGTEN